MQKDPSWNRCICIINKQTNKQLFTKPPWPLNRGTETKYEEIMPNTEIIIPTCVNKQEDTKRRDEDVESDAKFSSSPRENMLVWT